MKCPEQESSVTRIHPYASCTSKRFGSIVTFADNFSLLLQPDTMQLLKSHWDINVSLAHSKIYAPIGNLATIQYLLSIARRPRACSRQAKFPQLAMVPASILTSLLSMLAKHSKTVISDTTTIKNKQNYASGLQQRMLKCSCIVTAPHSYWAGAGAYDWSVSRTSNAGKENQRMFSVDSQ